MFKLKESYRRKLKLAESNIPTRRRRSTVNAIPDRNSFSVEFRTRESGGILLFAEDVDGNFTVLHVSGFFFSSQGYCSIFHVSPDFFSFQIEGFL